MISFTLLVILLSLSLIKGKSLRNLKLTRDESKYKALIQAANKTAYQLYELKDVDFKDRNSYSFRDKKKYIYIVIDENPTLPTDKIQVKFNISKGVVNMPELDYPPELKYGLEIFGRACDLKEEFKAIANMVAAGYNNGNVIGYKKDTQKVNQYRLKCFVNSEDGKEQGSFEIIQEDLDDLTKIANFFEKWYNKIKSILKIVGPDIQSASLFVINFAGLKNTNSSSFLEISFLCLLFIFVLF